MKKAKRKEFEREEEENVVEHGNDFFVEQPDKPEDHAWKVKNSKRKK